MSSKNKLEEKYTKVCTKSKNIEIKYTDSQSNLNVRPPLVSVCLT